MPDTVTIINNGGEQEQGIITNLIVSGYAQFGTNQGSLFSPEGHLQISGDFVAYNNIYARGGLYVNDLAASNYAHGAFIRGAAASGDAVIDGSGLDFVLTGSGQILGPVSVDRLSSNTGVFAGNSAENQGQQLIFVIIGSGLLQGPVTFQTRPSFPTDVVWVRDLPLYVGPVAGGSSRVLSSGELSFAAGASPGGNTAAVQFNTAGSFTGVDALRWVAANNHLVVSGFLTAHNTITAAGSVQLSGTTVAYGPLYATDQTAAGRYVTSGEMSTAASTNVLNAQTSVVGVDNVGTATLVYSYNVPSGLLGTQGGIEVDFYGHYLNNTLVPRQLDVTVQYGGQLWLTGTLSTITNNAAARALNGRVQIDAAGSASAQRGVLSYALDVPSTVSGTGTSATLGGFGVVVTNPYVAVQTNAPAQELRILFQHSTADPDLRAFVYNVTTRRR